MIQLKKWLRDYLNRDAEKGSNRRARPGQKLEGSQWIYAPRDPYMLQRLILYAMNAWVFTGVNRIGERYAMEGMQVRARGSVGRNVEGHPLLDLLGEYGQPNDAQDSVVFYEQHFQHQILAGNVYWYLGTDRATGSMSAPTEIYLLEPQRIHVIPGRSNTVAGYRYLTQGQEFEISPMRAIHHKKASPLSVYYGMGAVQAVDLETRGDRSMALWNNQMFGRGVAIPAGVMVVSEHTSDIDLERIRDEMNAVHEGTRATAVLRAPDGASSWHPAGMEHRDMDFKDGRLLSRQAVMDAIGLPLGVMSETSTEAHARVAMRQLMDVVWLWHKRTARPVTAKLLPYYDSGKQNEVYFKDVRMTDWEQKKNEIEASKPYMTINEIRQKKLGEEPMEGTRGDEIAGENEAGRGGHEGNQGGSVPGDSDATGRTNGNGRVPAGAANGAGRGG